jgi:hypothetical protein
MDYSGGKVRVDNGQVFYGDFPVANTLTERVLKMMSEGFKADHMLRFLENLMANPSARAVRETYTFLENYGLPITDDGCFLAYKAVTNDYKDIHSRKFDNSIGAVVSMLRNQVDDNYGVDCSQGLHVGALDYVVTYGHFTKGAARTEGGNRLLIVKVNPANVVSVPRFEGFTKMRVCEYTVVSEILDVVKELDKIVYTSKALALTPDLPKPKASAPIIDKEEYLIGYEDGQLDFEDDSEYGFSRNYDAGADYLAGYNDGYHDRSNKCESTVVDDLEYQRGFADGSRDCENGQCYGCSRDYTMGDKDYLAGYNDAYNGRDNQFPNKAIDRAAPPLAGTSSIDEDEYDAGYELGSDDAYDHCDFEENLEIDASDQFKIGYRDGYNERK